MRVYSEQNRLLRASCNCCGKDFLTANGFLKEECIHVEHSFGFFGAGDGLNHKFDLCEDCYRRIIGGFAIPVEEWERTELL